MRIEHPHPYSNDDARQRIDALFQKLQDDFGSYIAELRHSWNDAQNEKQYSFKIHGIHISGQIELKPNLVVFRASIPLAVRFLANDIEQMIRKELEEAFA
ncbi:polyhydroxyalkanoic acid system family protein [candidate division KSB1 bacterium]|nr:polyhydroxyalkanoic acid system family protein [candidate division KSB1 bacterium]